MNDYDAHEAKLRDAVFTAIGGDTRASAPLDHLLTFVRLWGAYETDLCDETCLPKWQWDCCKRRADLDALMKEAP
jgi:hypothetical protein